MMPLAFHTGFLCGYSARDAVRMVFDAGYDKAELNAETHPWTNPHIDVYTPAGIIAELAKLGPYCSICVHHDDFGSRLPERREHALEWTMRMMERASDLDVDLIHVIPGGDASYDALIGSLSETLAAAEKRKLKIALEPIVNRVVGTAAQAQAAIDAVPGLKINFDPSHMHVMGDDIVEGAAKLCPHIAHVHLKDARGKPEDWAFVALGAGEIDLKGMMRTLADHGYGGPVSIEHESHIFAGDKRTPAEVLPQCREYFGKLIADLKVDA